MKCKFCSSENLEVFADLGHTGVSNAFIRKEDLHKYEEIYPLTAFVCKNCFLVQVEEFKRHKDIFNEEYVYFSSISSHWMEHCRKYSEMITEKLALTNDSFVIEIASNDGYLLKNFTEKNINCLGIEPTASTANTAIKQGINTLIKYFGEELAEELASEGKQADLIIGNNVIAHDPNLLSFVKGLKKLLKPDGTINLEFPHLQNLIEKLEFDTIYHEHFFYFSFYTINKIMDSVGLTVYNVDKLPTHGGSLRLYIKHTENKNITISENVSELLKLEKDKGLLDINTYSSFQSKIIKVKNNFLIYILNAKNQGKKIIGFGAAAKGNTFINYCGIKSDIISFVVDETPAKINKFLPQSNIPVEPFHKIKEYKPDIIIIIPWNFKEEIKEKLQFTKEWGAQILTYIPKIEIL